MNMVQALEVANTCNRARKMAGVNADYPYTQGQLVDALLTIHVEYSGTSDQIKLLQAQLRAANARNAKIQKVGE